MKCSELSQLVITLSIIIAFNYSIVTITEAWLNVNVLDGKICLAILCTVKMGPSEGVMYVILAILNTFSFKLLPLPYNIEAVAVKIGSQKSFIICVL